MTILHNDIIKNIECFFPEVFSYQLPKNLKKLDMLAYTGYIVTYMGSEPLYVFKRQYPNGDIVEVKIWRVDKSADKPHGFKYSLAFIRKGNRLIGYDNAEGKGDHRHYKEKEQRYAFSGIDALFEDFYGDIRRCKKDESSKCKA